MCRTQDINPCDRDWDSKHNPDCSKSDLPGYHDITMYSPPPQKESAQVLLPGVTLKLLTVGKSDTRKPIYSQIS